MAALCVLIGLVRHWCTSSEISRAKTYQQDAKWAWAIEGSVEEVSSTMAESFDEKLSDQVRNHLHLYDVSLLLHNDKHAHQEISKISGINMENGFFCLFSFFMCAPSWCHPVAHVPHWLVYLIMDVITYVHDVANCLCKRRVKQQVCLQPKTTKPDTHFHTTLLIFWILGLF